MAACAVLDFGKTHWKAYVVTPCGEVGPAHVTPAQGIDAPAWRAIDVDRGFAFAVDALATLMAEHPFDRIIPVAHGAAAVLVDEAGVALPPLDYEWPIPIALSEAYDAARPAFAETGSPALPCGLNLGRQIWAIGRLCPGILARSRILPLPQYWAWRLSGQAATDPCSLGCHTDLWNPHTRAYSSLARSQGWAARFPPLRRPGTPLGPLLPEIARRIGAAGPVRVLCGIHDSNAALAAMSATPARSLVSTGTWTVVFAPGGASERLVPGRDMLLNVDVDGRPVPSARCMTGRERDAIAPGGGAANLAEAVRVAEAGLLALPSFSGTGPFASRAGTLRLASPTPGPVDPALSDPALRPALASLACALLMHEMTTLLDASSPVLVEGPAAKDDVLLAVLAALDPGRRVLAATGSLVAAGAARLAFGQCEPPPSIPVDVPDMSAGAAFRRYLSSWRAALLAPA